MSFRGLSIALGVLCVAGGAHAQDKPIALVGADLMPIDRRPIAGGVLIIQNGKILAIGADGQVAIPPDAERIDVAGRIIMPGLVDTHSHVGGVGGGDGSEPIQPDCRVLDSINVRSSGFRRALAGGLTTLNIMPGSMTESSPSAMKGGGCPA